MAEEARQSNLSSRHEAVYSNLLKADAPPAETPAAEAPAVVQPPVVAPEPLKVADEQRQEAVAEPAKPVEQAPPPPESPKLYAGKYKTIEELEKGYKEAERFGHERAQQAATFSKQVEQLKQFVDISKLAESHTTQAVDTAVKQPDLLDQLVNDPDAFKRSLITEVATAASNIYATQTIESEWKRTNPDLVPYSHYISSEIARIVRQTPEAANDPEGTLRAATDNFRTFLGAVRGQGKQEVTQMISETKGSALSTVPQSGEHTAVGQPKAAPAGQTFDEYLAGRRAEYAKRTGGYGGIGPLKGANLG